jgi:hypothetical protein
LYCITSLLKTLDDYFNPLQKALLTGVLEGLPEEWMKAMAANEGGSRSSGTTAAL